ncbi:MAG: hypothetical protein JXB13_00610 [Phycisphaerae bacterium]|nr:hypothetical protein [Phycisphaerae bacterium]
MKRAIGLPSRVLVAGVAYGATCAVSILATYASWRVFEASFGAAMGISLVLWLALGYFPARYVYGIVTYKVFGDGKHCEGCGYDLTGNLTGVCPECGIATALSQAHASAEAQGQLARRHLTPWLGGVLVVVGFVCAVFLGYWWAMPARVPLPDEFRPAHPPIAFARLEEEWELADDTGLSYYVISNAKVVARLTFDRDDSGRLAGVGVADVAQRFWLDVNVGEGTFARTIFASQTPGDPGLSDITLQDVDADGVPDRKKEWTTGAVFRRCEPLRWEPLETTTKPEQTEEEAGRTRDQDGGAGR